MGNGDVSGIMEKEKVFLSLGSNLGKRFLNIHNALREILNNESISIIKSSALYLTEPVDYEKQRWFLNLILEVETDLSPFDLLRFVKEIEFKLGRRPTFRKGPRIIDLDILFYGDKKIITDELTLPHPEIHKRDFILKGLLELRNFVHPTLGKSIKEIFAELKSNKKSYKIPRWVILKMFHFGRQCQLCNELFKKGMNNAEKI